MCSDQLKWVKNREKKFQFHVKKRAHAKFSIASVMHLCVGRDLRLAQLGFTALFVFQGCNKQALCTGVGVSSCPRAPTTTDIHYAFLFF